MAEQEKVNFIKFKTMGTGQEKLYFLLRRLLLCFEHWIWNLNLKFEIDDETIFRIINFLLGPATAPVATEEKSNGATAVQEAQEAPA